MDSTTLIENLLDLPESAQGNELAEAFPRLSQAQADVLVNSLLERVIELQWSDTRKALQISRLILQLAGLSGQPAHRATGLRAEAQTRTIGLGEYQPALALYEEALAIYRDLGDEIAQARVEVTRIWALASLGRYREAIAAGENAGEVLRANRQWRSLATLKNNLAMIYRRAGESARALAMLDEARSAYLSLGREGETYLANNELNRALVLYEAGDMQTSLEASQAALALAEKFKLSSTAAIAQHNLGMTYFRLGRSNEALQLFDSATEAYLILGQRHNAALSTLSSMDCLLELGRFSEVLEKCAQVLEVYSELGMLQEAAETHHIQAQVYTRLRQYDRAIQALNEARRLFEILANQRFMALIDLGIADLKYLQGRRLESLSIAEACALTFENLGLPFEKAQAQLLAARSATLAGDSKKAEAYTRSALSIAGEIDLPFLAFQGYHIQGRLSEARGDLESAQSDYARAIETLERLRGNVMVEFQPSFVEDKEALYADMVALCLRRDRPEQGLLYAERAKSRALLSILSERLDLGIHLRKQEDGPLVAEILQLRQERERLLRQGERGLVEKSIPDPGEQMEAQRQLQRIEERISELWHKLLVRNADYAREASLWQVQIDGTLPDLEPDELVLEYFALGDRFVLFLVSAADGPGAIQVQAVTLPWQSAEAGDLLDRLELNIASLPFYPREQSAGLIANVQGISKRLYQLLLEPVKDVLEKYSHLIFVPHGPLHYLPFHALYDGEAYLIEKHQVSYQPGLSFIHRSRPAGEGGVLAIGDSMAGALPDAAREASLVAEIFNGQTLLEDQATRERVQSLAPQARLLHFACHGDFRPDNPLFSGLNLADGWVTTLDIFNLRLEASLVTLSACQTGRSVIGGGDELLGLMRAFLAAGAASLLISHWLVEDRSTALLMESFYRQLFQGESKAAALRQAQRDLLHAADSWYAHPYYWAPFFLTGQTGRL